MRLIKKIGLGFLGGLVVIQFIQPARNQNKTKTQKEIEIIYNTPDKVLTILKNSCYDCHSNITRYPWYSFIQPGAWWMASHIRNGKKELNFSEFGAYSNRKQQSKLKAISSNIKDNTMPLSSYLLLHKNAKLTKDEKALLLDWISKTKDSLSLSYK